MFLDFFFLAFLLFKQPRLCEGFQVDIARKAGL